MENVTYDWTGVIIMLITSFACTLFLMYLARYEQRTKSKPDVWYVGKAIYYSEDQARLYASWLKRNGKVPIVHKPDMLPRRADEIWKLN